jgi:hypothetical protein
MPPSQENIPKHQRMAGVLMPGESVVLRSWRSVRIVMRFWPAAGTYLRWLSWDRSRRCAGFGYKHAGAMYAMYRVPQGLFFQWGRTRARLGDAEVRLHWSRTDAKTNRFSVHVGGEERLAITYASALTSRIARTDPSFDALDEELEDFFQWSSGRASDPQWVREAAKNWTT